jgi:hypothetical protein
MSQDQIDELAAAVGRLSDIEAVKQLKAHYIRLIDARAWDTWGRNVLTDDCHLDAAVGIHQGAANIVEAVGASTGNLDSVHRFHSPKIEITGADTAPAVRPILAYSKDKLRGMSIDDQRYGHYVEDYIRIPEVWRLDRSELVGHSFPSKDRH